MSTDIDYQRVADEDSLANGALLSVSLDDGERVCLARVGGEVFAVRDRCTHAEFPLSDGSLDDEYQLECCLHGAVFDVRDGSVTAPPADDPVTTYAVKVEDGGIWVGPPTG